MKLYHYILSLLIILLVFSGCKKYDEGPTFSLQTKKARITNVWEFSKQTPEWSLANTLCFENDGMCYLESGTAGTLSCDRVYYKWEFDQGKENILFLQPLTQTQYAIYKIIKLARNELKLQNEKEEFTLLFRK